MLSYTPQPLTCSDMVGGQGDGSVDKGTFFQVGQFVSNPCNPYGGRKEQTPTNYPLPTVAPWPKPFSTC